MPLEARTAAGRATDPDPPRAGVQPRRRDLGARSSPAAVVAAASPALAPLGLELQKAKRTASRRPTRSGDVFVSIFTTFGSFSIAAGILLIFLIFVMLSAERRSELGIARAIGTRREHLVQLFVFEGLAYDLGAALVGAALGVGVAFAMVTVMADAFDADGARRPAGRDAAQPGRRLRARRAAHARRRGDLGLAREPAEHRLGGPRHARAASSPALAPLRRARGRRPRARRCAGDVRPLGQCRRPRSPSACRSPSSASSRSPRPSDFSERIAYTVSGLVLVTWWLLPFKTMSADRRAPPGHGLLGVDDQRPHGGGRRHLGDRLQRRRRPRARHAGARPHPRRSPPC